MFDGRAQIVVPGELLGLDSLRPLSRLLTSTTFGPADLDDAPSAASVVFDDFVFMLYLGADEGRECAGVHDGRPFSMAADLGTVDVYVTIGVEVRRSRPEDLDAAARDRRIRGGRVGAFRVAAI